MTTPTSPDGSREAHPTGASAATHLRIGWWSLLVFLAMGAVLEGLHGLKLGFYLDPSNEMRRLLWTLSHAHGSLLALVHIAFAASLPRLVGDGGGRLVLASRCLIAGGLLLPLGFFLGGVFVHEGDPGLAIVLAPVGALLLLVAVGLIAIATRGPSATGSAD
jgi:hypothetical protein